MDFFLKKLKPKNIFFQYDIRGNETFYPLKWTKLNVIQINSRFHQNVTFDFKIYVTAKLREKTDQEVFDRKILMQIA